ncbi:MAG: fibronectin type III domain-containing protein, partial [Nitrospirae bacterium]|nr:fibronectin type III domain-containing protein [Nitrospirota bacterium]
MLRIFSPLVFIVTVVFFTAAGAFAAPAAELIGDIPPPPAAPSASGVPSASPYAVATVLYDNGPLINSVGTGAGGADESRLQDASLGMSTYGLAHQVASGYRVADDFTLSSGTTIDAIVFYAYQTGSTTTSTMTAVNYRIWDGPPGQPGSSVIFGDTTTNRLLSSAFSNIYRTLESAPGGSTRPIMKNTVSAGVTLNAGTYWIDWQTDGTLASGPWAPPITINGQTTTGNAQQYNPGTTTWTNIVDSGTSTPQGLPFQLLGNAPGTCGSITMTHSVSQSIVSGNSIACNSGGIHTDNSYWRTFTLSDFGVLGDMSVCSVEIGVEQATAPSGSQPLTIRLYTSSQPFPAGYPGSLTLIGSVDTTVANGTALTVIDVPVTAAVPAGSELVVEVFTPNGQAAGNSFFIGSNSSGQSSPSYISAGDCGVTAPTDVAALGFPNVHIVKNVKASAGAITNIAPVVSGVGVSADVLSWTYTDADSDPQTSYEAAVCPTSPCTTASADVIWSEAASNADTSTTIATTLIKGSTYYAAVRANDGTDWSAWTETSFDWSVNNAPTAAPVSVSGTTVSWTYGDVDSDPQSGFEIEVRTGAGGSGTLAWSTSGSGTQTSAAVTGSLLFNQTYFARVRVNDGTSWGAWSETSFSYAATAGIITPNGGEEIPTGSTYRISWDLTPFFGGITPAAASGVNYKLFLSTDSGTTWTKLADGLTSTSYDWYLPAQWGNLKKSLVRVVAINASGSKVAADVSDATFTIAVVKITSPEGGSVSGGSTVAITWDTFLTMRPAAQTAVQIN